MSIGKKAGKGFLSLLYRGVLEKIMGLAAMLILARQLTPYDFGLVSITEVLLTLISVIGTTGLSEFLQAYRKENVETIFKSAFWFSVVISCGILLLFFIVLPIWAYYQGDRRIINIGMISGMIFLTSQLQAIPKAWFSRNLMFDELVKIQAPFIVLIPLAKILAVYIGLGVYSLIIPTLLLQPVLALILYRYSKLSIGRRLYKEYWGEIYHFTKHLIGSTMLGRITDQSDKFILGKFLGLDKLGIYNIASQMADLFTSQLIMFSNNILSSVLPKYVNDKQKFYSHYMGFLKTFAFFVFPVIVMMLLTAKPVIAVLYGPKWAEAASPMQILLVFTAIRAVTSSYGPVMNSFHLNKKAFIVTLTYAPVHIAASIIGSFFGVAGVASAVVIVKSLFINWHIKQIMTAMSQRFLRWYNDLSPYFLMCTVVACLLAVLPLIFPSSSGYSDVLLIACTAILFLALYLLTFRFFFTREAEHISGFLAQTFPRAQRYFNIVFSI